MPSSPDETPVEHHIPPWEYDAFISHAGEDKAEVARPLAEALRALGLLVWYDEFELRIGDNLRRKIDDGIAKSKFGIVIRHGIGAQNILPIWHRVTKEHIISQSPSLASVIALTTSALTIEEIAAEIASVIQGRE